MPYDSETFDIAVAGWTLAYSDSLETALLEIHRVLKLNGILIMTFDLREGEGFNALSEVEIANHDASLLSLITPFFKVKKLVHWKDVLDTTKYLFSINRKN